MLDWSNKPKIKLKTEGARLRHISNWAVKSSVKGSGSEGIGSPSSCRYAAVALIARSSPSEVTTGLVKSHAGIICTGETYNAVVKLTFAKGASLNDPLSLFNSSLEGNTRRAIDIQKGEKTNEKALKNLFTAAAALNTSKRK